MLLRSAALALPLLLGAPAFAQDSVATEQTEVANEGNARLTLGAGGAYYPDYEGSSHNRWSPIPAANGTVAGMSFTVLANRASLDVIPNPTGAGWDIQLGPIAVLNQNRSNKDAIMDLRIRRLGEIDTSVEVGGYAGIGKTGLITSDFDKLTLAVSYRKGISGDNRSGVWNPSLTYSTPLSTKIFVSIFTSAEIAEDRYAQLYFGVTPAQAVASGLPAYRPQGGQKDISFGGFFTYALAGNLTKGLSIVAGGTYKKLVGDFADSPLVRIAGDRNQWTGAAGLALTF